MTLHIVAADDSVTMRKILQMTFAGEDVALTLVTSARELETAMNQQTPNLVVLDAGLNGDGYGVAKSIQTAGVPVVLMASQQMPFDPVRASEVGVTAHVVKPFETQSFLQTVRGHASAATSAGRVPSPPATAAAPPPESGGALEVELEPMDADDLVQVESELEDDLPTYSGGGHPAAVAANQSFRGGTAGAEDSLSSLGSPQAVNPPPAAPPGSIPVRVNEEEPELEPLESLAPLKPETPGNGPRPVEHSGPTSAATGSRAVPSEAEAREALNGLSREVVERIVWEVVPDLAETIIREEIRRLTREG